MRRMDGVGELVSTIQGLILEKSRISQGGRPVAVEPTGNRLALDPRQATPHDADCESP